MYRIVIASLFLYGAKVKNIFLIPTNDDNILKYLDKIQIKIHRLQDDLGTIKSLFTINRHRERYSGIYEKTFLHNIIGSGIS